MLPKGSPISKLIIAWCHKKTGHAGRGMTLNEIRTSGFWIVGANSATRKSTHYCVVCRSLRGKLGEQKMAELPFDRLQEERLFTYCEVDLFGPFVICSKRKELKRYGVMFTSLCSRAIHIEVAHSLDTDSLLLTLQRFIVRRENIRQMRSDNGSNFVGAVKELRKSFQDMNHSRIIEYLQMYGQIGLPGSTIPQQQVTWEGSGRDRSELPEVVGNTWEKFRRRIITFVACRIRSYSKFKADDNRNHQ